MSIPPLRTPPTWPSTFIVVRKRFDVQDTSLMSQQILIREKGRVGEIRYSAQNSLCERNFAYIENPI